MLTFALSTVMVGEGRPSTSLPPRVAMLRVSVRNDVDARDKPWHPIFGLQTRGWSAFADHDGRGSAADLEQRFKAPHRAWPHSRRGSEAGPIPRPSRRRPLRR